MKIKTKQFEVEVIDEPMYSFGSTDNCRQYEKEYLLGENYRNASRYGILVKVSDGSINSCIVLANGGNTSVHEHSAVVIDSNLFLAIGNLMCCFDVPSLELKWHPLVDTTTCFGVYVSPDNTGLISHGEVDIAKVGFNGEIEWSVSGKNIFTEGFQLFPDYIEAIDFNHESYHVELSTGQISVQNGGSTCITEISLLDFFRTGHFGPIQIGMTRQEVYALLGQPDGHGCPTTHLMDANIWLYDAIELHFMDTSPLWLIWTDHISHPDWWGSKRIKLDAWYFSNGNQPSKSEIEIGLKKSNISYRYIEQEQQYEDDPVGKFLFESGVEIWIGVRYVYGEGEIDKQEAMLHKGYAVAIRLKSG